jgi:hypothetical protein
LIRRGEGPYELTIINNKGGNRGILDKGGLGESSGVSTMHIQGTNQRRQRVPLEVPPLHGAQDLPLITSVHRHIIVPITIPKIMQRDELRETVLHQQLMTNRRGDQRKATLKIEGNQNIIRGF